MGQVRDFQIGNVPDRFAGAFVIEGLVGGHQPATTTATFPDVVPMLSNLYHLPIEIFQGDIDTVVFTHLHFDHVGWNLTEEDGAYRPTFPKARHVIHRKDWDVFEAGADPFSTAMFQQRVKPLEAEGLVELIDGRLDLGGGLVVEPAPGHTLGHVVLTVSAGDDRVVLAGIW